MYTSKPEQAAALSFQEIDQSLLGQGLVHVGHPVDGVQLLDITRIAGGSQHRDPARANGRVVVPLVILQKFETVYQRHVQVHEYSFRHCIVGECFLQKFKCCFYVFAGHHLKSPVQVFDQGLVQKVGHAVIVNQQNVFSFRYCYHLLN